MNTHRKLNTRTWDQWLLLLTALALAASAQAATYTWRGTNSTAWSTPGNWLGLNVGPTGAAAIGHRLDVNNQTRSNLVYDASLGTTIYGTNGIRGLVIGSGANGSGTMTITGGTFITTNTSVGDVIGNSDNNVGTLNISGGTFICDSAANITLGLGGGTGRRSFLNIDSGSCIVPTLFFNSGAAVLNLDGGTLAANALTHTFGANTNNFNGGILQARTNNTSFIGNIPRVNVRNGGAIIDTAGFNVTALPAFQHSDITGDAAMDGGLTKLGAGTLTLNGTNTYTGPTVVRQGTLVMRLPSSSSALTLANGAAASLTINDQSWSTASVNVTNATLNLAFGNVVSLPASIIPTTALNASGSNVINIISGAGLPVGTTKLIDHGGSKVGGGTFTLGTLPPGMQAGLVDGATAVSLVVTSSVQALVWSAGTAEWATNGALNWNSGTAAYQEYPGGFGDIVTFNDTAGTFYIVTITNDVKPLEVNVNIPTAAVTFNGAGKIAGTTSLFKTGAGILTLANTNTYDGATVATGGTLQVLNGAALGSTNGGSFASGGATLAVGDGAGTGVVVTGETITISGAGVGGARGALRGVDAGNNVWAGPVIIGANEARIGTEDGGRLTVSGPITGATSNLTVILRPGANGTVTISGSGSSYGQTRTYGDQSATGVVKLGANNAFATNAPLALGLGFVDLNGFNQTVAGLFDIAGPGTIKNDGASPSTLILNTGTNSFGTGGSIVDGSSTLSVVKQGTGTQQFYGSTVTYSGSTTVSEGRLDLFVANMNSAITVAGGATLSGEPTTSGSLTLNANSTLIADPSTPVSLAAASVSAATGPIKVGFSSAFPPGDVLVLAAAGGITGSAANFQAVGVRGGTFYLTNSNTELYFKPSAGPTLVWKGNDPTNPTFWDVTTTTNWLNGASPDVFYTGDAVVFNDTASSFNVAVQGSVSPSSLTFNHSVSNYVVSGGAISGGTTVTKSGSGTVTLANNNSYTGTTAISGGTVVVQHNNALGAKTVGTTVSGGGTLDLGGTLAANALNLGAEVLTVSGAGVGGAGAVINSSPNTQINAVQQMVLAGNAAIGGPGLPGGAGRWDMRGAGNQLDMAGYNLTKVGGNYVALVGTTVINPGNIEIAEGILGIQLAANLNGSPANTLTVGTNGTLEFYQSSVSPTWTLNLTNGSRIWAELGSGTGTNVWAGPVTVSGEAILDANGGTLTISGNVSGSGSLLKIGPNTVRLEGNNSYAGGTTITNFILVAASDTALGTGPVTINPNARRLAIQDGVTITNAVVINGGSGEAFRGLMENTSAGNATLTNGPITINGIPGAGGHFASTGGGTLTVASPINSSVAVSFRAGTGIFRGGGSYTNFQLTGTILLGGNNGLSTLASLDLGSANGPATFDLAGYNQSLAGITRVNNQTVAITNGSTATDSVLTITGASSYPGLIRDAGVSPGRVALVVNGGDLTLSGANTYSGGTVVTNGTLRVNTTTAAGTGAVAVKNGGTLTGNGTVSGAATLDAGSTLAPGNNGIGTLTFSGGLALAGNIAVELDKSLPQSNDLVSVTGGLNNTGTGQVIVSNLGPALIVGDKFTLFSQPLVNGNLLAVVPPPGVTFANNLAVDGSITVLAVAPPIPTTPTNITFSATSSNITIGWPSNYTGWTLQTQTNPRSIGLKTNWVNVPGSELTNAMTFPINKTDPTVFFRLIYTNAP